MQKNVCQFDRTILVSLVFFVLSGCAVMTSTVSPENRLPFDQDNTSQGVFSHGDLTVDYNAAFDGPQMTINGRIAYRRSFDSLDVSLLVIDAAGTVMQRKLIYASGFRSSTDQVHSFSFQFGQVLPPGAAGISFSYAAQERRSHQ